VKSFSSPKVVRQNRRRLKPTSSDFNLFAAELEIKSSAADFIIIFVAPGGRSIDTEEDNLLITSCERHKTNGITLAALESFTHY
jgi:hypothetical protein